MTSTLAGAESLVGAAAETPSSAAGELPAADESPGALDAEDLAALAMTSPTTVGTPSPGVSAAGPGNGAEAAGAIGIGEIPAAQLSLSDSAQAALVSQARLVALMSLRDIDYLCLVACYSHVAPESAAETVAPDSCNLTISAVTAEEVDNLAYSLAEGPGALADLLPTPQPGQAAVSEAGAETTIDILNDRLSQPLPWIVGLMAATACEIARRQVLRRTCSKPDDADRATPTGDGPPGLGFEGLP